MHIEPGIVSGAKMALSYATAAGAVGYSTKLVWETAKERGLVSMAARSILATGLVFSFFQILPHYAVGVSEVHLILGSTLFLILGSGPAAIGLAVGLLLQGLFFTPFDLPQYGINVTTLLVPLFAMRVLAGKVITPNTAYVDLTYRQAVTLSTAYQGGIVTWVAFWAFYGQGFGAQNIAAVSSFGAAYMLVVLIEPLIDLAVLATAKTLHNLGKTGLVTPRLFQAAQ